MTSGCTTIAHAKNRKELFITTHASCAPLHVLISKPKNNWTLMNPNKCLTVGNLTPLCPPFSTADTDHRIWPGHRRPRHRGSPGHDFHHVSPLPKAFQVFHKPHRKARRYGKPLMRKRQKTQPRNRTHTQRTSGKTPIPF